MPRMRLGVVLLVEPPAAHEIDGLRRAVGDGSLDRVPPHITLVPPVNVRTEEVPVALAVLRDAAAGLADVGSMALDIGPVRSFAPVTRTLHLAVDEDAGDASPVFALRVAVFRPPLERALEHPFVPHLTIADEADPTRIDAALVALADYRRTMAFDRVTLLEEQRIDGRRRWVPVADAPFRRPAIVGRGGVELELWTSRLVDPEAASVIDAAGGDGAVSGAAERQPIPLGAAQVVVTARRAGTAVGVAVGWAHPELAGDLTWLAVHPDHRGVGIARHLTAALSARVR